MMERYESAVRNALLRGVSCSIKNSSREHAAIILREMLKASQSSFHAYARALSHDVWNSETIAALEDAKRRGVDVRLLIENDCDAETAKELPPLLCALIRKVRYVDDKGARPNNFAVADGCALRFETDPVQRSAIFFPRNLKLSRKAESLFCDLYLTAETDVVRAA